MGPHARLHRRPGGWWRLSRRAAELSLLAAVAVVLTCGTAYAYWSSNGQGSATIAATTAQTLGVTAAAVPAADLYPGKTSDLSLRLSNANAYPVSLTRLTAVSVTSSDPTSCPAANITFPPAVTTGIAAGGYLLPTPIAVPASSTATPATLSGLVTMATAAPDGCQGKTFTISLSFTGSQA